MAKYKIITGLYMCMMLFILLHQNPFTLLSHHQFLFHFNANPVVSEFFLIEPIHSNLSLYIFQKGTHLVGFGILYKLFQSSGSSVNRAFFLSVIFALLTEILQLYFGRTGRLTDVGINMIGILIAYLICLRKKE